ncbi:MAG: hypothetical protein QOD39_911, partial [Mycobacterium sp.]|nr:hypothetical protein [Mycobacterium sp.]
MTTELNEQQLARLAKLSKRNPNAAESAAVPVAPVVASPTTDLNEQQLARLAKLGKRNGPAAARPAATTGPTPTPAHPAAVIPAYA